MHLLGQMRSGAWPRVEQPPAPTLIKTPRCPEEEEGGRLPLVGLPMVTPKQVDIIPAHFEKATGGKGAARAAGGASNAPRAKLVDGKALSVRCMAEVREGVARLTASGHSAPSLVVVLVGSNPASQSYIGKKLQAAAECGIDARVETLDETVTQAALLQVVERLNADETVHGIIVQLPLPSHIEPQLITNAVSHAKDVDGFTQPSLGSVAQRGPAPRFCPCTPKGCLRLVQSCGVPLRGKEAVIIGASNIVGVPMALLLLGEGCTVSVCHIDTTDTAAHARRADILVVACGVAGLVQPAWVKPGAIVIDVGINFVTDASKKNGKRMVGDCAPEVAAVAGHLTPVPGGVGPMTVAMLMQNTLEACERAAGADAADAIMLLESFEAEEELAAN